MINRILLAKRTMLVGLGLVSMTAPVHAQTQTQSQSYVPHIAYQQDLGTGKGNATSTTKSQAEELPAQSSRTSANRQSNHHATFSKFSAADVAIANPIQSLQLLGVQSATAA